MAAIFFLSLFGTQLSIAQRSLEFFSLVKSSHTTLHYLERTEIPSYQGNLSRMYLRYVYKLGDIKGDK